MIQALFTGLFTLVINLTQALLSPIDSLISSFLPQLDEALSMVTSLFTWIAGFVPWAISWLGFKPIVIQLVVAYFTFVYTVPFAINTIKSAIKWYRNLKI